MQRVNGLQIRISRMSSGSYAVIAGLLIGVCAALVGLLLAIGGPVIAFGVVFGLLAAMFILVNLDAALYGIIFVMALLPFGTFPFKIGFTPTLLDAAFGAFIVVYLLQYVTRRRTGFKLTPVHGLIALYMGWLIFSFVLGLRWARPTTADLRQFAETLLSIGMAFILVDVLRDERALRRLMIVLLAAAASQAIVTLALYVTNDQTAERLLIRLARIGYPNGGVIRYIEDNPDLAERAIGTWVDPNALGGYLAISAVLFAPQLFAKVPLFRPRLLVWAAEAAVVLALLLTFSRASLLAVAIGLLFIGLFRGYRGFLALLAIGIVAVLVLPQTKDLVARLTDAFTGSDLATQMRLGEYGDALELIARYPVTGVGFTGSPSIDLYTDVASMYLIMANQIGLVGVALFAISMGGVLVYGLRAAGRAMARATFAPLYLGALAALLTALINGAADLYFFRTDFQASITLFWLVVGLALAVGRLARIQADR